MERLSWGAIMHLNEYLPETLKVYFCGYVLMLWSACCRLSSCVDETLLTNVISAVAAGGLAAAIANPTDVLKVSVFSG